MSKILITGASGFIGSHLINVFIELGFSIRATAASKEGVALLRSKSVEAVQWSLDSEEDCSSLVQDISHVYHLATNRKSLKQIRSALQSSSTPGLDNLITASLNAHVERVVFASSTAVYGKFEGIVNEYSPTNPSSLYSKDKLYSEKRFQTLMTEDLDRLVIIRFPGVDGAGNSRFRAFQDAVRGGRFRIIGDGRANHHSISIDEAVEVLIRCSSCPLAGGKTLVVAGHCQTFKDKVEHEANQANVSYRLTKPLQIPARFVFHFINCFPILANALPSIYNTLAFQIRSFEYDTTKSVAVLGDYRNTKSGKILD